VSHKKINFRLWTLLCLSLLSLFIAGPAAHAQDDDEDDGGGFTPELQWKLADTAWNRREYDDAAALMMTYVTANPDQDNSIEAWWRTYEIFRAYRPNEERRKSTFTKAVEATVRWERKYATSNKERASQALWYRAHLNNNEVGRPQAILILQDLVKKFPGTAYEDDAYWYLGEWLREANRPQEAIDSYQGYRKVVGNTEQAVMAHFREGWMYEALKDNAKAIATYREIFESNYNWGWHQMLYGSMDAASRLVKLGEPELARAIALKIIDKAAHRLDLVVQARKLIGDTQLPKRVLIESRVNSYYTANTVNVDGRSKVKVKRDLPVLVRLSYVDEFNPVKGTITLTPKVEMDKVAENATASTGANKTAYTGEFVVPGADKKVQTDWRYSFAEAEKPSEAPDGLVITRKWENTGKGWGMSTIRVQSNATWYMYIYLPNEKTNPNNINIQPNAVQDGGKTFRWDHHNMQQGLTLKFPVEVGAETREFYPKIVLSRDTGAAYAQVSGVGKEVTHDSREFATRLEVDSAIPYTINFPSSTTVTVEEVKR